MIGIIEWRMAQCSARGVEFRFNTFAESRGRLAEKPDVVIVATGGLPHTEVLGKGNDLVVSSWDHHLRRRQARQARCWSMTMPVIMPALQAAEMAAAAGAMSRS
jgi:hypothetical protein